MMDSKHEGGSNKLEATTGGNVTSPELHDDAGMKKGGKKKSLSSASSLSSSSSSATSSTASVNALEFNRGEEDLLAEFYPKSDLPHSPLSEGASPLDVSGNTPQWSMVSASPRTGPGNSFSRELPPTPDWTSPTKSPLTQTMGRGSDYDPNRIPSSIFATRPSTPMEWSVASNESLFSIHLGNSSFSKDHVLMVGDNKQEDWSNAPPLHMHSGSKSDFTTNLAPVMEAASEHDKNSTDKREEFLAEQESQKSPKTIPGETVEESKTVKLAPSAQEPQLSNTSSTLSQDATRSSVSAPRVSEESANSRDSFAFPVLETNEGQKNCSLKAIEEKPEEKLEETKPKDPQPPPPSAPKEAQASWFSCLQCLPRCC